jgi:ubiquinone/menaquinone biosynthesis C-methylase UbiE
MKSIINKNSQIYYKASYWNDLEIVRRYMSKNFTGDEKTWWITDFKKRYAKNPFKKVLFLNCGDGRFDREFIDNGIAKSIYAFDISPDLISKAKKNRGNRNIKYEIRDVNKISFKNNEYDLAVNIAALHHVQYINRLCRILAKTIKKDGYIVNFDYIGPHRNQYPARQWGWVKKINNSLPEDIRHKPLKYPHLLTMLLTDPTEAIHSEKIISCLSRYFNIIERHDTGGGIAYPIITHNSNLIKKPTNRLNTYVKRILRFDNKLTKNNTVPPLFSYFIATPNKNILNNKPLIKRCQADENRRETVSLIFNNTYSFRDYLKTLTIIPHLKRYLREHITFLKLVK